MSLTPSLGNKTSYDAEWPEIVGGRLGYNTKMQDEVGFATPFLARRLLARAGMFRSKSIGE